jgi:hypothetical protein
VKGLHRIILRIIDVLWYLYNIHVPSFSNNISRSIDFAAKNPTVEKNKKFTFLKRVTLHF